MIAAMSTVAKLMHWRAVSLTHDAKDAAAEEASSSELASELDISAALCTVDIVAAGAGLKMASPEMNECVSAIVLTSV